MKSVIHFTTVHPRTDTRIRLKQATTLAQSFDVPVILYVQDGQGDERGAGPAVMDTGRRPNSRIGRMTVGAWRMFRAVRKARPQVAHFHDPELIPIALVLKLSGIKVVYDVHEDLPRQILSKHWIPRFARRPVAVVAAAFEWAAGRAFDAMVPATPAIAEHFPANKCTLVQNFPLPEELVVEQATAYADRPPHVAYVGGVTRVRGIFEMVKAMGLLERKGVRLKLVGNFAPAGLEAEINALPESDAVDFLGWADRKAVAQILGQTRAGLVLFQPEPNHIRAQPNKLFEYMAAGLPLIASDFPLWRSVVQGVGCGLLVDPRDPAAIAKAVQWIIENPVEAEAMGKRGRRAVRERYNWDVEGAKLIELYRTLLGRHSKQMVI